MITALVTGSILLAAGSLPALALTRSIPSALVMAPIISGCLSALAVMSMLVTKMSWAVSLSVLFAICWLVSAWVLVRRKMVFVSTGVGWLPLVVCAAGIVPPLWTLRRPPGDWDAISIWFFHARWFFSGPTRAIAAMTNPAFAFSHADYPPLGSATAAAVWQVMGEPQLRTAQFAIAIVTWSAVLALCVGVVSLFNGRTRAVATAAAVSLGLASYGSSGWVGTDGYVDLLWAALICGATVHLVAAPSDPQHRAIGLVLLISAALTKNEGAVSALVVGAVAVVRSRRQAKVAIVMAAATSIGLVWIAISSAIGAISDISGATVIEALLPPSADVVRRAGIAAVSLADQIKLELIASSVVIIAGSIWLDRTRRQAALSPSWHSLIVWFGMVAGILVAYATSPYDVRWHLGTSVNRTRIGPSLLLLTEMAIWAVLASSASVRFTGGGHDRPRSGDRTAQEATLQGR